jgi:CBS domain-containing protein
MPGDRKREGFGRRGYLDLGRAYGRDYGSEGERYGGFRGRGIQTYSPRSDYDRGKFPYSPEYGQGPRYAGGNRATEMEAEMKVMEIMSLEPEVISPDASIRDAAKRMRAEDIGAIPVGENDRLVGMVTDRDIATRAVAEEKDPRTTSVRDVMSKKVFYIFDDEQLDAAARCMSDHQVRRLPVLNHDKRLVGIVSLGDLALTGDNCEKIALEGVSEPSDESRR